MPNNKLVSDVQATKDDNILLTKEMIEDAVKTAVENVISEKEQENIIDDANELENVSLDEIDNINDLDDVKNVNADINKDVVDDTDGDNEEIIETDVAETVDEEVKEQIDLLGDFNFLGIDVHIEKNDNDKYDIVLTKDETTKEDTLDDITLQAIFDEINAFFDEWAIDDTKEDTEVSDEEVSDEEDNFEDLEELELEESNKSFITSSVNINSLVNKYSKDINDIFEHGLEAKAIALDMVKNTILANSIRELIDKSKSKDKLIANKEKELKKTCNDYILARNMNNKLNEVYNTLLANIKEIKNDLSNGLISENIANKTLGRYNTIISKVLNAKKVETLTASLQVINKTKETLLAYKKENENRKTILANKETEIVYDKTYTPTKFKYNNKISKEEEKQKNTIVSRNVYNREGMKEKTLSSRHNGINDVELMTAEICSIAGL